ncbi:MAG: four helix bundle protein [Gemmatimonadales bacterium]
MHPLRGLAVFQRSRAAAVASYSLTSSFPQHERFGLTSQIRRASVSVVANIAEGAKRTTGAEFARFLNIAEGSAAEVGVLAELSVDLGFAEATAAAPLVRAYGELERMLCALRARVSRR